MPLLNAFVVDSDAFVADSDAVVVPANGSVNGMVCPGVPAPPYLRLPAHAHDVGIENVYWWPVHTLVVLQFLSMTCWSVIYASIIIIYTELVSQALHVYIYACSFACWCWQNIYGTYTCDMHFHAITSAHSTHPISCHSDV
jgi:hypothetical protein